MIVTTRKGKFTVSIVLTVRIATYTTEGRTGRFEELPSFAKRVTVLTVYQSNF